MPLNEQDWKCREAAAGYAQLGMWLDADAELDNIDPFNRAVPIVLALRIEIYRGLQKWELMAELSKRLVEWDPQDVQWIISYAFATRRAVSIEAAREILRNAVRRFPKQGVICFNLACYECQLGRIESAKDYLKRAFEIEPKWRVAALDDEDLQPIWNQLQAP
jgi:tetratricopeptide (TPR) repeat protein